MSRVLGRDAVGRDAGSSAVDDEGDERGGCRGGRVCEGIRNGALG